MNIDFKTLNKNSITNVTSKNSFGEVFTPQLLIEEMLDLLPKGIWKDGNKKWLDPAAGVGNFHALVFKRLMEGLEDLIPNEKNRAKHIIETMLYFVEIQEKNVAIINQIFNPENDYKLNLFCGDFCGLNMYDFKVYEFDIVLGNPPYQDMLTNNIRKAKNHNLWTTFIELGFKILNPYGYLLYVTPQAWMSPSSKVLQNIFLSYQLHFVNIGECSKYFKGVGSQFSYYLIEKTKTYKKTTFLYEFKGGTFIKNLQGISDYRLNKNIKFIPQIPIKEAFTIFEKTVFSSNLKYAVQYDSDLHRFTKKEYLADSESKQHVYKTLHTPTQIVWSNKPHKNQDKIKLFIPLTTYYENLIIDTCGNTQGLGYIIFENFESAEKVKYILSKKLYRFIANITRWSNFNVPMVMKCLPLLPQDIEPTDESIYKHFNLNDFEIELIENSLRPNRYEQLALAYL